MAFRSEEEQLRAGLEARDRELAELKATLEDLRAPISSPSSPTPWWIGYLCLLGLIVGGSAFGIQSCRSAAAHEHAVAVRHHQEALEFEREHLPLGVSERNWSWCIDHCQRWRTDGSDDRSSYGSMEGVVVAWYEEPAVGRRTVTQIILRGPWLSPNGDRTRQLSLRGQILNADGLEYYGDAVVGEIVRVEHAPMYGPYDDEMTVTPSAPR